MEKGLFRAEAVERQGERLWGDLILSRSLPLMIFSLFLAAITGAALLFLATGDYSRRQQVQGYLVPDRGLVEVSAPREGVLTVLPLHQGDAVRRGQLLFEVAVDRRVGGALPVSEGLLAEVAAQQERLARRLELEERALALLQRDQAARERRLRAELSGAESLLALESSLAEMRQRNFRRAQTLAGSGLLSRADLEAVQAAWLEQRRAVETLRQRQAGAAAALEENRFAGERARLAARREILRLEAERAELRKQGLSLEGERRNRVLATVDGTVAGINGRVGQLVAPGQLLVSLVPADSALEAELMVPSNAVAFLAPGQAVNLRLDAFPYQKFGVQRGVLREVAGSPVAGPAEGRFFRARARLPTQTVQAYGAAVPLRPGMLLRADVVVEERSLLHWLLDPLLSMGRRL